MLKQTIYKTEKKEIGCLDNIIFLQNYFECKYGAGIKEVLITESNLNFIITSTKKIMKYVNYYEDNKEPTWSPDAVRLADKLLPVIKNLFENEYQYDAWYFLEIKKVHETFMDMVEQYGYDNLLYTYKY